MTTYIRLLNALDDEYGLDFFVFENVPGLLRPKNHQRFTRLKRELSRRFHITLQEVNAHDFGVPQVRRRILIFGLRRQRFMAPLMPMSGGAGKRPTVREAIGHLVEPAYFQRNALPHTFPEHPNHWTMNPKSPKFLTQGGATGRSFMKLEWDKPSKTVAYGHREIHVHPTGHRRLSVYEGLLLQGFPSTFELKGSLSDQVQQVSNAVPPPLARVVAAHIKAALFGDTRHERTAA